MRFCPFCSAENVDEATHCSRCARRLPPLPARRKAVTDSRGRATPRAPRTPGQSTSPPAPRDAPAGGSTSSLSSVSLGPAALRRKRTTAPPPPPGSPTRRASDRPDAQPHPPEPEGVTQPIDISDAELVADLERSEPIGDLAPPPLPEPAPPRPPADPASSADSSADPSADSGADSSADSVDETASNNNAADAPAASSPAATATDASVGDPVAGPPRPADDRLTSALASLEPPPTHLSTDALEHSAYNPAEVRPIPEVPEAGWWPALSYSYRFVRAWWQRKSAIKKLNEEIREHTGELDKVLGALGKAARDLGVENRALVNENAAIDAAEERRRAGEQSCAELENRQAEENSRFGDVSRDREQKLEEAQRAIEDAQGEQSTLEAQRRSLRDKRKTIERKQKAYLKAAEDREEDAAKAVSGDQRVAYRRSAADRRRDAAELDPERQDLERRLSALDKPLSQAMAKVEALRVEVDAARRALNDAREGHRHRLAELEAEQGRRSRELAQAEAEILRRLVTLGTLVNLHRVTNPELSGLYSQIDTMRGAIGKRSREIDRLTAEREAYDKSALYRGLGTLGVLVAVSILLIVILSWIIG